MGTGKQLTPVQQIQGMISSRKAELKKMLPKHIDIDTFERAANNALMRNPEIAECDPTSVYDALMRCSQDGLIPDGREAHINIFNSKGQKKAQYQPMIDGVLKRLRQSGMIESISAKAVFEGDEFDYWFDENGEHVKYRPDFNASENRQFKLVFAYAKLKGGEMVVEVMPKAEVDRVRAASRAGSSQYSPWANWYDRMAVKSALHRLSRRLPSSSETIQMIATLEHEIDARFENARNITPQQQSAPESLLNQLDQSSNGQATVKQGEPDQLKDVFGDE